MLRLLAFIIVIGFFTWAVPKLLASKPLPDQATMATVNNGGNGGMSGAEVSYYYKIFDYAMDNVQADQPYTWKSYSASGNIVPAASFVSKSGATCRKFKENAIIGNQPYDNSGVACRRKGDDGWCKLREDNALTCAMEGDYVGMPGTNGKTIPGLNMKMPGSGNGGAVNVGGIGTVGNINTNDTHIDQKKAGSSYADTVTGTAGSAAGPAASNAMKWFGQTFR